jgi:23S rRNA pseudouridine1911/1915/1917 synthase
MNEPIYNIIVPEENAGERLDIFVSFSLEDGFSRSRVQSLVKAGHVLVNAGPVKNNYRVRADDSIEISLPEPVRLDLQPEDIPIDIIFEDDYIAVINKPPGLTVHPGPGNYSGTLVNALLFHMKGLSSIGGVERPGIVHRLDKDTSGLMVIAKTDLAHQNLTADFAERKVHKEYTAVVTGRMKSPHDTIDLPLGRHPKYRHRITVTPGGKEALTEYTVKKYWSHEGAFYSLLSVRIHTGRTHQIRVHLSQSGNPIIGDPIYSRRWERHGVPWLLLASTTLAFTHPVTGDPLVFRIDPTAHITAFMDKLDRITQ